MPFVYLNGEFLPSEKASISPLDRGFIFGDGVYEVIPVFRGCLFRLEEHLHRLEQNLAAIRIKQPLSNAKWNGLLTTLVQRNSVDDQFTHDLSLYLQITRGVASRDHAFPADITPTIFVMCSPLEPLQEAIKKSGIAAITLDDIRWKHCNIKAISLLPNILLRQQALDANAAEAILIRNSKVTEGAASNVFIVKNGMLITPPKGPQLLPGITRDLILELAQQNQISSKEAVISQMDLRQADEIWLTSSTKEILPVTTLDNKPVAQGKPGPMWETMTALYQNYKKNYKAD